MYPIAGSLKRLIASCAILFLALALIACGGDDDKDDGPGAQTSSSGPTTSASSGSTAASSGSTAASSGPIGAPSPTDVPAASNGSSSGPTEASLRAYLAQVDQALKDKDWAELYSLTSDEYQANCDLEDLIGIFLFAQAFLGEDFFNANTEISDVVIEGNRATYTSKRVLNGSVLDTSEESLVYENGRWVEDDPGESDCAGEATSSGSTETSLDLSTAAQKREATGEFETTSDSVSITVNRVIVADYKAFYAASDSALQQRLDTYDEAEDAVTIGQIEVTVENRSNERKSVYPEQATIVVGNEQVETPFFLSDDIGGEYFPGVVKEGKVFFFLERTPYTGVDRVLYAVDSPFGDTFNFDAEDFEFSIEIP